MRSFLASLARPRPTHDLASKTHVDLYDYGLSGPEGANVVMQRLQITPKATHINLGHNPLGDLGLSIIVAYLCRPENDVPVEEFNLNNCGIGDSGLFLIAHYVKHNATLRRLFLMGNNIVGTSTVAKALADALNHSGVQTLVLTNNEMLSDNFLAHFLKRLNTPYLRNLQLSRLGLTQRSIPVLSRFLLSPACYGLRSLHLNANLLSHNGLKTLVSSLRTGNTTLCEMEVYANSAPEAEGDENGDDPATRETTLHVLTLMLTRNLVYLKRVESESRALLVVARTLLLRRARKDRLVDNSQPAFPWPRLAPELQLYILRFVHTALSDAQHTRVCNYASASSTLPPVLSFAKRLKNNRECVEDFLIVVGCNRFEGVLA